jgi:hypothetical protein
MFKGTVNFIASIKGHRVMFPLVAVNWNESGVDRVDIEAQNGEIRSIVHLVSVVSHDKGRDLATRVNTDILNRLAFCYSIAIENARSTGDQFSPLNPQPSVYEVAVNTNVCAGSSVQVLASNPVPEADLKAKLEQQSLPGERYFGLFCSALLSTSPVEEFMHLYNILLMLYNDSQTCVHQFIISAEPTVQQTPDPRPDKKRWETVYTRLRNEFGHNRAGVDIDKTKAEMANHLGGLIVLTRRAIELHP